MKATSPAVFFVNVWPEPQSSAAGVRTIELSLFLQRLGYKITAVAPSAATSHSEAWEKHGVRTISSDPNSPDADSILGPLAPELVIFDRFYSEEKFGWRARELWPESLQMIDTIDLHFLRGARQRAHAAGTQVSEPGDEHFGEDFLREMASLHRADVCLVVSSYEADWLAENGFEKERVCYLPFSAHAEKNLKPFSERRGYCFIGNYMHAPNLDAIRWLEKELWPALRAQNSSAELHLYGAYPPQSVTQLNGKNGIIAHGFVENHRAAIARHEVMLAPLRFGAGIKGKVLEAWATGTPVLGTSITFESMGTGFAEFADAASFVSRAHELQSPEVWQANVEHGLEVLKTDYDRETIFNTLAIFLASSLSALPRIRKSLTGRMLRHHGAQSLKYFSKWIEEKNKSRSGN